MKKKYLSYFLLLALFFQFSCSSTNDIYMFQDYEKNLNTYVIPKEPNEHKIKPFDNLYINIMTINPEVNRTLNPRLGGDGFSSSGTEQMFGSPASQYINGYQVSADSLVSLPTLGDINLVDLNLEQAKELIEERAEVYLKDPIVQVKFLNFKININGEVRNPGIYYVYENSINILDAIGMASGITDFANLQNIVVKRSIGNKIYTFEADLTASNIYNSDIYFLQPNDFIYVPPTKLKRRSQNSDTYSKILATISTMLVAAAFFVTR